MSNIDKAEKNLARQLDWINRFDGRLFFVSGISFAMLGIGSAAAGSLIEDVDGYIAFLLVTTYGLLGLSVFHSLKGFFPKTKAANDSLLYFGSIGSNTLKVFKNRFSVISEAGYLDDLLEQIYINALILSQKFYHMRKSLIAIICSLPFWALLIISGNPF